jgi:hypothetical protein
MNFGTCPNFCFVLIVQETTFFQTHDGSRNLRYFMDFSIVFSVHLSIIASLLIFLVFLPSEIDSARKVL